MNRILISLCAAVLLFAACSGAAPAIVNGQPITEAELEGLSSGGAVEQSQLQADLFDLVSTAVALDASSDDFGYTITDEARQAERETIDEAVAAQGTTIEQILEDRARTEDWVDLIITQTLLSRDVSELLVAEAEPISDADVQEAFDAQVAQLAEVCASHILLDTEADADAAFERAQAGEDFAELAIELSTGPSGPNGGDLGCTSPASYVPEFADATLEAEVGVPFGPVQSDFGWHVILVASRDVPTFEESEETVRQSLEINRGNELYTAWIIENLRDADVSIDSDYGTWVVPEAEGDAPSISPPSP